MVMNLKQDYFEKLILLHYAYTKGHQIFWSEANILHINTTSR